MNPEVFQAFVIAVLFLTAFLGVGGALLKAAGLVRRPGEALRFSPVAAILGFAVYSYAAYPLLAFSSPHRFWVVTALMFGLVAGSGYWPAVWRDVLNCGAGVARRLTGPSSAILFVLCAGLLVIVAPNWFTPPREGDALHGYMFNARWIYLHGLTPSPYNTVYNLYPFNTEMVFALCLAFGNDIIPKTLDGLMGLVLLGSIYEFARRDAGRLPSAFAAASLAVTSAFAGSWASGKVDVLATATFFAGTSVLFLAADAPRKSTLAVAAFLIGTACAQKYTTWVFAAGVVAALPFVMAGSSWRRRLSDTALAAGIIAACLVPHVAKTIAWTGNPIAPFGRTLLSTSNVYLDPNNFSDATDIGFTALARAPYRLFVERGQPRGPGPFPLLLLVGLPAFLVAARTRETGRLLALASVLLVLWIVVRGDQWLAPRFLLVPTALLLVVAAAGIDRVQRSHRLANGAITVMMAALVAYAGIWQNRDWRRSWPFVLGQETRTAWHDRIAPARAFSALQAIGPELAAHRRLFIQTSLYYVPDDKLPYISTEREVAAFSALAPGKRLDFLRQGCFAFVHIFGFVSDNPPWTAGLPVIAQWIDAGHGLEYSLFRLDNGCDDVAAGLPGASCGDCRSGTALVGLLEPPVVTLAADPRGPQ